jgi:hypothetical protein
MPVDQKNVDEVWEWVKDRPGLRRVLDEIERIGLCRPIAVVSKTSKEDAMSQQDA